MRLEFLEYFNVLFIIYVYIGDHEAYKKQYMSNPFGGTTLDTGNELISKMAAESKMRWEEMITPTDLTGNSRTAWQTI